MRVLGGMALWGEEVICAAQSRDVALESWLDALETATEAGLEPWDVKRATGRESFRIGGCRYKIASSTRGGARGLHADLVVLDELREFVDWRAYAALEKTRRARPGSQFWSISNEGDMSSMVLRTLAGQGETWKDDQASSIGFYSWSADPSFERGDPRGWVQANPALGHVIELATIADEYRSDPPDVFETEVLCRPVMVLHPFLPEGAWEGCVEHRQLVPDSPGSVMLAVDAGPELRHASIAVAWGRPDGKVGVDMADVFDEADGAILPRIASRLDQLVDRWQPPVVAVAAKTPAEAAVKRAVGSRAEVVLVGIADLQRAASCVLRGCRRQAGAPPRQPGARLGPGRVIGGHARRYPGRRADTADVDAARAAVMAAHQASTRVTGPAVTWSAY